MKKKKLKIPLGYVEEMQALSGYSKKSKRKKKKIHYKFMEEGHAACTCCRLEYWKGSILTGFTIVLVDKENEKNGEFIDIPSSEFKRLKKVIKKIEKENKNGR